MNRSELQGLLKTGAISTDNFEIPQGDLNRFELQGWLKTGFISVIDFETFKGDLNRFVLKGLLQNRDTQRRLEQVRVAGLAEKGHHRRE